MGEEFKEAWKWHAQRLLDVICTKMQIWLSAPQHSSLSCNGERPSKFRIIIISWKGNIHVKYEIVQIIYTDLSRECNSSGIGNFIYFYDSINIFRDIYQQNYLAQGIGRVCTFVEAEKVLTRGKWF